MANFFLKKESDCMDMIMVLQIVALIFGVKELGNAIAYHKQNKTKWAIASLCMGIFACACAIISMTGLL